MANHCRSFLAARMSILPLSLALVVSALVAYADAPPLGWYQVNQNGFVAGLGASSVGTTLTTFDNKLYAFNSTGVFRMTSDLAKTWTKLNPPAPPNGPGPTPLGFVVLGGYAYSWTSSGLWYVPSGKDPGGSNWTAVSSSGLTGGASPLPRVAFNSNIYGVYHPSSGGFEIWRGILGTSTVVWTRVVQNAFSDPTNNKTVDQMAVYNGHIYALTGTLKSFFGDPTGKDSGGVEVWESSTGNSGEWSQINVDGFGTYILGAYSTDPNKKLYTNHVVGSVAVHQGYLYVGTNSHWGAEIWRYSGIDRSGWTNVTPPWAGPGLGVGPPTYRFWALYSWGGDLYAGEGYPSGNLDEFDGANWNVIVAGPSPFDPYTDEITSIVSLNKRLYVAAGSPAGTTAGTAGDQVWGFQYATPKVDIKANGSDGPIIVSPTKMVTLTITLNAGDFAGQAADWYLVVWAPWGIYSVVWGQGFTPGIVPFLSFPLFNMLSPLPIFASPLPTGTYTAAFGVAVSGTLWWDAVVIKSQ